MTPVRLTVMVLHMTTTEPFHTLELQEFELTAPDTHGHMARLLAAASRSSDTVIPLLTSIERPRDVAVVRGISTESEAGPELRTLLGPFVRGWADLKRYRVRIAERSQSPPVRYRLAVTESGIDEPTAREAGPRRAATRPGAPASAALLWIGLPIGTHAGLLVLVGSGDGGPRADPRLWPLPMSRALGVRIYEGHDRPAEPS